MVIKFAFVASLFMCFGNGEATQYLDNGDNFGNYVNQPPDYSLYFKRMDQMLANYRKILVGSFIDDDNFCETFKFLQPQYNSIEVAGSHEGKFYDAYAFCVNHED